MKRIFDDFTEIGIAVKSAAESAALFHDVYGIGPWSFYDFGDHIEAICSVLNVRFALIEEKSSGKFSDLIAKREGPALCCAGFSLCAGYEETKEFLEQKSVEIKEYGMEGKRFAVCDTNRDLGIFVKIFEDAGSPADETYCGVSRTDMYPADGSAPTVHIYSRVGHLCLSAEPCMEYVKRYHDEYSFGPWIIVDINEGPITDRKFRGKLTPHTVIATNCFMCSQMNYEINAGVEGDCTYAEFYKKYGAGIHHIMMEIVVDPAEYFLFLTKERGFEVVQSGVMTASGSTYMYIDAEKEFGTNIETFTVFHSPDDPPEYDPPTVGTYPEDAVI